ncbi:MAG: hypothetical protein U0793_00415 [Gemmataceae bacterium]
MPHAILFMQWDSYQTPEGAAVFFAKPEVSFNSRQERLHGLAPGDMLWLVSRRPDDQQYYFVAALRVASLRLNPPGSPEAAFGPYAIVADRAGSRDLGVRFPAEGLLRALQFDPAKPIKYGASIGQSLQTLRLLAPEDGRILESEMQRLLHEDGTPSPPTPLPLPNGERGDSCLIPDPCLLTPGADAPFGLWTKCDRVFADYFLTDWQQRKRPLAFLLYDPPPVLPPRSPVFIHSDKALRLTARFVGSQFVAGYKLTAEKEERLAERERVWNAWRADTIDPPAKADFDVFWDKQHGVRALFVMQDVAAVPDPVPFKTYGRALEWGYPQGVGYRYLSRPQSFLLQKAAGAGVSRPFGLDCGLDCKPPLCPLP